jgi:hypothetical protein
MSSDKHQQEGLPNTVLRPPGGRPASAEGTTARHGLIWIALSVVVVLGLVVLFVLPKLVPEIGDEKATELTEQSVNTPAQSASEAGQELADSRGDAEQALQDFLHTRARLELANAPVWGEPEWSQAVNGAARANDLFAQRQFSMANEAFTESLAVLQRLESETGQRLAKALDSGWQALEADDSVSAITSFETALAIEVDNESAIDGLERAGNRPEILKLMASAELARSDDELEAAQLAYLDAVELDREYEPASKALLEITEQITQLAFADAMSQALGAMATRNVQAAEVALRRAASLKPGDPDVRDTQYQLAQLKQKLWLASQRREGTRDEQDEDWSGAVAIYREVLSRVPQAAFAREGLARAQDRQKLHQQLDHYLKDPTRVWADQPRANAEKLIASAGKPPGDEARLTVKIERLQTMIVEAQTPQTVTLQSDGLTSISIYHVGRLGQFTSQQLELRPGTYTVVGSRPGFRDVRQTFTVKPGSGQTALIIRCEEPV